MEVEPRMRSSTNASTVAVAKITGERGWRVEKKCLCVEFWLTRRSGVRGQNAFWGSLQHEQQAIACCQTYYDYGTPKMPLNVKFANSLSLPSTVKKVRTGSKSSQGT